MAEYHKNSFSLRWALNVIFRVFEHVHERFLARSRVDIHCHFIVPHRSPDGGDVANDVSDNVTTNPVIPRILLSSCHDVLNVCSLQYLYRMLAGVALRLSDQNLDVAKNKIQEQRLLPNSYYRQHFAGNS